MSRTLIIGYGNLDRADDGVAYHVIRALRRRLGQSPLDEHTGGLEELGGEIDSVFLTQLVPELTDTLVEYDGLVFVDAHVLPEGPGLQCSRVLPDSTAGGFTHQITPAMILALLKALHRREPTAHILAIRAHSFDWGRQLSATTESYVETAVDRIVAICEASSEADAPADA